jgi:hypothetical protein
VQSFGIEYESESLVSPNNDKFRPTVEGNHMTDVIVDFFDGLDGLTSLNLNNNRIQVRLPVFMMLFCQLDAVS